MAEFGLTLQAELDAVNAKNDNDAARIRQGILDQWLSDERPEVFQERKAEELKALSAPAKPANRRW